MSRKKLPVDKQTKNIDENLNPNIHVNKKIRTNEKKINQQKTKNLYQKIIGVHIVQPLHINYAKKKNVKVVLLILINLYLSHKL